MAEPKHSEQEIIEAYKRLGTVNAVITRLAVGKNRAYRVLRAGGYLEARECQAAASPVSADSPGAKPAGKSFTEFRQKHDYTHIIERAVAKYLPAGGDVYYEDGEFRILCGVPVQFWRRYSSDDRFLQNRVLRNKSDAPYWAPANMAEQMRNILGI